MAEVKAQQAEEAQAAEKIERSALDGLLTTSFKPKNKKQEDAVKSAVNVLASQAVQENFKDLISKKAMKSIDAIISAIDKKLSEQVNLILHHNDFQNLEGSWRGLKHLVFNTETDESLKVRVMNISKEEVRNVFEDFEGAAFDQSPLFKKVYEFGYGIANGEPFGAICADYYFDHSATDMTVLKGMAKISASAHAPLIGGTSPKLFNMDSWTELNDPRDLKMMFQRPEYAPWNSFREEEDSRYVSLTMPRTLSRLPYGADNPVKGFDFEEDTGAADHSKFTWSNAAYAMATNVTRAFKAFGWCTCIRGRESGGIVEGLPVHTFDTDDGGTAMKCPAEVAIPDRRENELAEVGMMPLIHYQNTDYAVFIGAQTVNKPAVYDNPDATSNAKLAARLPYIFATCRFAHYLKCMVRDKIGSFKERGDLETELQNWIANYVTPDPNAGQAAKAKKPLAEAKVEVKEVEGNPGYYSSVFWLRPHYQLEGLTVSLRLTGKLPSV